ncbi:MAG: DUF503 domain-containing protein [Nitrospinae bacterium]|nr:DUF503 domain-containing protein [Nitrospinota bacterium]
MVVGVCKVSLALHGARSLKSKRQVIKSVKDRVRARFNISIAEVDHHDLYQSALLGLCVVSADAAHADSQLQHAVNFIAEQAEVTGVQHELITL